MLSGLKNLQSTGDPSECGYLHIPWNISIPTTINEIQYTARGKITWKQFHIQLIWSKQKLPSQELQGII